jgi:hypothetical protein
MEWWKSVVVEVDYGVVEVDYLVMVFIVNRCSDSRLTAPAGRKTPLEVHGCRGQPRLHLNSSLGEALLRLGLLLKATLFMQPLEHDLLRLALLRLGLLVQMHSHGHSLQDQQQNDHQHRADH